MASPSIDEIITEVETWFQERIRRGPGAHSNLRDRLERLFGVQPKAVEPAPTPEPPRAPAAPQAAEPQPAAPVPAAEPAPAAPAAAEAPAAATEAPPAASETPAA